MNVLFDNTNIAHCDYTEQRICQFSGPDVMLQFGLKRPLRIVICMQHTRLRKHMLQVGIYSIQYAFEMLHRVPES